MLWLEDGGRIGASNRTGIAAGGKSRSESGAAAPAAAGTGIGSRWGSRHAPAVAVGSRGCAAVGPVRRTVFPWSRCCIAAGSGTNTGTPSPPSQRRGAPPGGHSAAPQPPRRHRGPRPGNPAGTALPCEPQRPHPWGMPPNEQGCSATAGSSYSGTAAGAKEELLLWLQLCLVWDWSPTETLGRNP